MESIEAGAVSTAAAGHRYQVVPGPVPVRSLHSAGRMIIRNLVALPPTYPPPPLVHHPFVRLFQREAPFPPASPPPPSRTRLSPLSVLVSTL